MTGSGEKHVKIMKLRVGLGYGPTGPGLGSVSLWKAGLLWGYHSGHHRGSFSTVMMIDLLGLGALGPGFGPRVCHW